VTPKFTLSVVENFTGSSLISVLTTTGSSSSILGWSERGAWGGGTEPHDRFYTLLQTEGGQSGDEWFRGRAARW